MIKPRIPGVYRNGYGWSISPRKTRARTRILDENYGHNYAKSYDAAERYILQNCCEDGLFFSEKGYTIHFEKYVKNHNKVNKPLTYQDKEIPWVYIDYLPSGRCGFYMVRYGGIHYVYGSSLDTITKSGYNKIIAKLTKLRLDLLKTPHNQILIEFVKEDPSRFKDLYDFVIEHNL